MISEKILFFICFILTFGVAVWLITELFAIIPIYQGAQMTDLTGIHRLLYVFWLLAYFAVAWLLGGIIFKLYLPWIKKLY